MYANRIINEKDIIDLIDPVLSLLLENKNNLYSKNSYGRKTHLLLFYDRDSFIEIHDDLLLDFDSFLSSCSITRDNNYQVIRYDNFETMFMEFENGREIQAIYARHHSDLENVEEIRCEFRLPIRYNTGIYKNK